MSNFYEILGVENNSTQDEIKKAWRKLSFKHHPDRNNMSSNNIINDINNAYDTLGDINKRKQYDNELRFNKSYNKLNTHMNPNENIFNMLFKNGDVKENVIDLSSIFGLDNGFPIPDIQIIGSMGMGMNNNEEHNFSSLFKNVKQQNVKKTKTINCNLDITLEESYTGITKPIEISRTVQENNISYEENETIYIEIKEGTDDGEIITVKEKGNISNNFKGDVKIYVKICDHEFFKREGLNLIYKKKISLKEALCGFNFNLNHINNNNYTINNKTGNIIKNNYIKVIPKMGFKRNNDVGNLVILFDIFFPETLTNDQISELNNIL